MSEKNQKKAYFLKKTIKSLGLKNADVINQAITPKTPKTELFDVITARALAKTTTIINLSKHLLSTKGKFFLMKGTREKILSEVAGLDNTKYSYAIHKKTLPNTQRHILEISTQ